MRSGSHVRTISSLSCAAAIQGSTFAWWSRPLTTISSPGRIAPTIERERWNVRVVMFGPSVSSAGATPSMSASAAYAPSTTASDWRDVGKAPPWLAFVSR